MSNIYKNFNRAHRSSSSVYEYITSSDQLIQAFNDSKRDLNARILKQKKRDRYLVNKAALEKAIIDTVIKTMYEGVGQVADAAADDIVNKVCAAFNGISGSGSSSSSFSVQLGKALGKGLGQVPFKLLDEIMKQTTD